MKETIYTIPLSEAFDSGDECPFCQLERAVEQRTIRYVLGPGASYMEPDVRAATDPRASAAPTSKRCMITATPWAAP